MPIDDPLLAPPPPEVPLANPPLIRVLCQLRFPMVAAVEKRDFIAGFQEAIRPNYPVLRQEQTHGISFGPDGTAPLPSSSVWRFADVDGVWRLSLASTFLSLETTKYISKADFLARLSEAVRALEEQIQPKLVDRLGVRFIDRLVGGAVARIGALVRPEVLGLVATPAAAHALHSVAETLFATPEVKLLARWGRLPPNVSIDLTSIEPIAEESWILDLDAFADQPVPFSAARVADDVERFCDRIYTFFRWAVTDDFLRHFGGKP